MAEKILIYKDHNKKYKWRWPATGESLVESKPYDHKGICINGLYQFAYCMRDLPGDRRKWFEIIDKS